MWLGHQGRLCCFHDGTAVRCCGHPIKARRGCKHTRRLNHQREAFFLLYEAVILACVTARPVAKLPVKQQAATG